MTWLTWPIAAIAAAALIPSLLLLYFLKLKRRDVEVSTTLLWKKSIQDLQANAPFQRLRRNVLLLLQLLALAAGLLAVAQPEFSAAPGEKSRRIIVIDRSASMSAIDGAGGEPRLARAKRAAIEFVESLREPGFFGAGARQEAMVIAFASQAEVVQPFTSDKSRLRRAVESIEPTHGRSLLDGAMRLSGAYADPVVIEGEGLRSTATTPIHLWSDGRIADAGEIKLRPETPLTYHRVGAEQAPNVAITALRAERAFDEPNKVSVFVGLQSTSPQPRDVEVELTIDGLVAAIKTVRLPAAGQDGPASGGVVFNLDRARGGEARVRIRTDDALTVDDRAWLALAPAERLAVALVTEGDLFLRSALEGLNLSRLAVIPPRRYQQMVERGETAAFDVIVFSGWAPEEELPPGRYVFFGAVPPVAGVSAEGPAEEGPFAVIDWSRDHPSLRHASLANVVLAEAIPLRVDEAVRVLARADAGPAIVEVGSGGARAIVTSFEPAASNWPFEPGFVLFVASAVRHLGEEGAASGASAKPGEPIVTRLPKSVSEATLIAPDGSQRTVRPASDGRATIGEARTVGMYRLRWAGEPGPADRQADGEAIRPITVSLLDPHESRIDAEPELNLASRDVQRAGAGEDGENVARVALWPWLLAAALGVVMIEWFVYNRRVQV